MGDNVDLKDIRDCYVDKNINIIAKDELQRFSVLIPIIEDGDEIKILFEMRAKTLRSQPGEISFPGGRIEENEDSKTAAIRETCEELGISEDNIEVIGCEGILQTYYNKLIYVYVGKINNPQKISPSEHEVEHVFQVPIKFLKENKPLIRNVKITAVPEEDFPYEETESGKSYRLLDGKSRIYFYKYMNYNIWGLTAKILHNFINTIWSKEREI